MRPPAKPLVLVVGSSPSKESIVAALETAGCTLLSTQALLTAESQSDTADGQRIRDLMAQNKLVPVATLLELLKRALDRAGAGPVLLPDFPRGVPQLAQLQTRCGEVALALQVEAELSERSVAAMVSKLPAERVRVVASADEAAAALKAAGLRFEPRRTMPPRHLVEAASSSFAAMIQRSAEIAATMREKAAGAMCAAASSGSQAQRRPSPDGRRPGSAAARPTAAASPPRAAMPPRPASAMPRASAVAAAEANGCGPSQMLGPIVQMSDPPSRRRNRPSSGAGCRPAPAGCGFGGGCGTSSEGSLAAAAMRTPGAVRPSSAQPRSAGSSHGHGHGHGHGMSADMLTGISPGTSLGTSLYKLPRQRSPPRAERLQRTPLYTSVSSQRQALVSTLWSRSASASASSASKPLRARGGQAAQGRPSSAATRRVARGGGGGGGGHRLRTPPQWDDSSPTPGAVLWKTTPNTREWEHRQRVDLLLQLKGPQRAFSAAVAKSMLTAPNSRPWSSPPKPEPSQPQRRLEEEAPPPSRPAERDDPSQVVHVRLQMHDGEPHPGTLKPRLVSMQVVATE